MDIHNHATMLVNAGKRYFNMLLTLVGIFTEKCGMYNFNDVERFRGKTHIGTTVE